MTKLSPAQTDLLEKLFDRDLSPAQVTTQTAKALDRRGLAHQDDSTIAYMWKLTPAGRELAETLFGSSDPDPTPPAGQPRKVRNVKDASGKTVIRTNTADTARIAEMLVHQQATERIRDRIRHRTTRVTITRDYPLPTGAVLHGRGTQKATSKPVAARKPKQAVKLANMQRKRRKQANKAIVDLALAFRDIERKRQRVA